MGRPETTINLLRGWPAAELLPSKDLQKAAEELLSDPAESAVALQYGPDAGPTLLRDALALWLAKAYNVTPNRNRICITGGASQNLACILQRFADPNFTRYVWLVAPCYYLACPIFEDSGFTGRLRAVPEDVEGVDVAYLARGLELANSETRFTTSETKPTKPSRIYSHVIYVVPTSANPSGKTMSLRRRTELVHLARIHDALIICDDVYDILQWSLTDDPPTKGGASPRAVAPRLCDIDMTLGPSSNDPFHYGNTVSNGSFSKVVAPGMRTGWAEGTAMFISSLSQAGATRSGGSPSQFGAMLMWKLLEGGHLDHHLDTITLPILQRRCRRLLKEVRDHLIPLGVEMGPEIDSQYGGYFIWLSLPTNLSSAKIASSAESEENLIIGHGELFEVRGDEYSAQFRNHIRLSFSWEPEDVIAEGIHRLSRVLKAYLTPGGR